MKCCGVKIQVNRNADFRNTYTPSKGYTLSGMTARMQVREYEGAPDPALLNVSMAATSNGSVFTIVGSSLVLTLERADLETLPVGNPISKPVTLHYDIILTDGTGFENYFVGGQFIVYEGITR